MSVHNPLHDITLRLDTTAAGTGALARHRLGLPGTYRVVSAYLMPDVSVAADAANGTVLTFQTGANEAGLADRASHSTLTGAQGALTAGTPVSLTPTSTITVDQGEILALEKVEAGTGAAFRGSVIVTLERYSK